MRKCFFVTPIGDKGSEVRIHSDQVLRHLLKPVCSELDFEPIRVDKIAKTSVLTDDIFNHLKDDDLVIVDITGHNPNVFLELGYRMGLGRPYIIIQDCEYKANYPFDISNIRIMSYSLDLDGIETSKSELSSFIKNTGFSSLNTINVFPDVPGESNLEVIREPDGGISINVK